MLTKKQLLLKETFDKVTNKLNLMEGKPAKYDIYHESYTSAVNAALEYAVAQGYTYDQEEVASKVGLGPAKPSEGKTNRFDIPLALGNSFKKMLHFQIYNTGRRYELNAYIS